MMATVSQRPAKPNGEPASLRGIWPRALPRGLRLRKMDISDLDRLVILHAELHALHQQEPAPFVRETDGFFADHLTDAGEVWGLWEIASSAQRLAGYTVLGLPGASDPANFGRDLVMSADARLAEVAHLDGTGILPHRRGIGLQRYLTGFRMDRARALGRRTMISMASPHNGFSLSNLLFCGLTVQRLIQKYDAQRFVLARSLPDDPAFDDDCPVAVPLHAKAEDHQRCLSSGRVGVALRDVHDTLSLVYVRRGPEVAQ